MTVTRPPIVVGVDGSPGADLALTWALDEGRSCALPVRLVYAYGWAMTGGDIAIYGNLPNPELLRVRSAANELLEKAASRARQAAPDVEISTHRIGDDAVRVLIAESARASMIVVGTGHRRVLGSLLAGSVEAAVSALASCPTVVVRDVVATPAGPGAVVVGIDGGDESHAVLDFAFEYASRRSASLHAVVCWHPDFLTAMVQRPDPSAQHDAKAWLSQALACWREKYPDVAVHADVVRGNPVAGLIAAADEQDLLVVGRHGRHMRARTVFGSVSQGVVHHAGCTVAVVPTDGHWLVRA